MSLLNFPLIFCLKVKRGLLGVAWKAAKDQTKDAKMIAMIHCEMDGCDLVNGDCGKANTDDCRFSVFIDRERAIFDEILAVTNRIERLKGSVK